MKTVAKPGWRYLTWMLRFELRFPERAASVLYYQNIFPAPKLINYTDDFIERAYIVSYII